MTFGKLLFLLVSPLLLSACLLTPGQFASNMDVRSSGEFTFTYTGEIAFMSGMLNAMRQDELRSDNDDPAIAEAMVETPCWTDEGEARECTQEELAEQQANQEDYRRQLDEEEEFTLTQLSRLFGGIDISDDETMNAYAERLSRQQGVRSAEYRGNGVFHVDYAIEGNLDRAFVFPLFEGFEFLQPMVTAIPLDNGTVRISAPAFGSGASNGMAAAALFGMGTFTTGTAANPDMPVAIEKNGRFTITTDGEILTNNTENGPVRNGSNARMEWPVTRLESPPPETLIRVEN